MIENCTNRISVMCSIEIMDPLLFEEKKKKKKEYVKQGYDIDFEWFRSYEYLAWGTHTDLTP